MVLRHQLSRRTLLVGSAAAPFFLSDQLQAREAPSDRITVGIIGLGAMGSSNLRSFLGQENAQVVALCDLAPLHYRDREWGKGAAMGLEPARALVEKTYGDLRKSGNYAGCKTFSDFRQLCALDDLDAVVVATPDHWHALCTMAALRAGKDVYCEKPVTHLFAEGREVNREVVKRNAVFQTGSQQRSNPRFRRAVEIVRSGTLGKLKHVQVGLPDGYPKPMGDATVTEPPKNLDYDFWCGPGEQLDYMRARHHRWWRGHSAFGGGTIMDWIGHHNDIAHWGMGVERSGPSEVYVAQWQESPTRVYDTPLRFDIRCRYQDGVTTSISDQYPTGTKWIGEDGWLFVTRGRTQASNREWLKSEFEVTSKVYASPGHHQNFLDCVKSRKECVAPAEIAHRSITPGHLAFVAQAVGRKLKWDSVKELIVDDKKAMELLTQLDYRKPWNLTP